MAIASWTRRRPARLQSRLLLSHLALVALCLGGLGLWTGRRLQATTVDQAERHLHLQAVLMADTLGDFLVRAHEGSGLDEAVLAGQAAEYAATTGIRVTVADAQLRVLASTDGPTRRAGVAGDPEMLAARAGREEPVFRPDAPRDDERLFVAVPVLDHGQVLGYVQCSVPAAPIRAEVARHWVALLAAWGGALTPPGAKPGNQGSIFSPWRWNTAWIKARP